MAATSFTHLSDDALLARVRREVRTGQQVLVTLLRLLAETEVRRLAEARGFPSMYAYCRDLGFSEGESYWRVRAARLGRQMPAVLDALAAHKVTLTTVIALAPVLRPDNCERLLHQAAGRSGSEVDAIVAANGRPRSPRRDRIVAKRVPAMQTLPQASDPTAASRAAAPHGAAQTLTRAAVPTAVSRAATPETLTSDGGRTHSAQAPLRPARAAIAVPTSTPTPGDASHSGTETADPSTRGQERHIAAVAAGSDAHVSPATEDEIMYRIHVDLDGEAHKLLRQAIGLSRARRGGTSVGAVIKAALTVLVDKQLRQHHAALTKTARNNSPVESRLRGRKGTPRRLATDVVAAPVVTATGAPPEPANETSKEAGPAIPPPREAADLAGSSARSRAVPRAVRRAVYERDGGRCAFVTPAGHRCKATEGLEYDHIAPFARGGEHSVENVRLLCRGHNMYMAEQAYGTTHMDAAVERWYAQPHRRMRGFSHGWVRLNGPL